MFILIIDYLKFGPYFIYYNRNHRAKFLNELKHWGLYEKYMKDVKPILR
jgi:hypothetical protein